MQHVASHLPVSFQGNAFLYAGALASLMSIACLSLGVVGWMIRDIWRDRFIVHPKSLITAFRVIFGLIGTTAFIRTAPEVLYLQMYGDNEVNATLVATVLMFKRSADMVSLGFFTTWLLIFVSVYPHIVLALKNANYKYVQVDTVGAWPRVVRPLCLLICIIAVSALTAYSKVYGG